MFRIKSLGLIFLISLVACEVPGGGAPRAAPAPALTPITVQLKWTHQAQFAGFYAADQKGYYAEAGLAVTFIEGGPQVDLQAPVLGGQAQFGIAEASQLIKERAEGNPLRAIGIVYRRNPVVFISLAEAGITRPQDIAGKTVRVPPENLAAFHAMMNKVGVTPDQYTVVNIPNDLKQFASGDPQVWGVYANAFVLTAEHAGYKINEIFPDDYGVHFYADTIFTTDDMIANNPDLVTRFLRATLKGWTYAIENPEAAAQMVLRYDPQADVDLETAEMTASLPLVNTGEDHIGWMKPETWAGMEQTLRQEGELSKPLDVTQVYTMQFLEEIYK